MERNGHDNVTYFIGTEVEHSAAYGMKTLFVVGIQDPIEIVTLANANEIKHVYLGANHSFQSTEDWDKVATYILDQNILVTLDFDIKYIDVVSNYTASYYTNFIPMISIKIPNITKVNLNAVVKLDDIDFEATNPGVWCHRLNTLQTENTFTDWSKYTQDQVLK